jgi:hypothetical protein
MQVVSVPARHVRAGLDVLDRELAILRPTATQRILYLLLICVVVGLLAALGTAGALIGAKSPSVDLAGDVVVGFLIAAIGLSLLNIPFQVKLWRSFGTIRRLGLSEQLKPLIRIQREFGRLTAWLTNIGAAVGLCTIATTTMVAVQPKLIVSSGPELREGLVLAGAYLSGASLLFAAYLRKGQHRLRAIHRILEQERVASQYFTIKNADWGAVAELERRQASAAGLKSATAASVSGGESGYQILTSAAAQEGKQALDLDARIKVQNRIAALMVDPFPPESNVDAATESRLIHVGGAGVSLQYSVDNDAKKVRIYSVLKD